MCIDSAEWFVQDIKYCLVNSAFKKNLYSNLRLVQAAARRAAEEPARHQCHHAGGTIITTLLQSLGAPCLSIV